MGSQSKRMVKVLFSGGVPSSEWETFFQRVKEVQFSAHGPFDILFMVGKAFESVEQYKTLQERLHALTPLTIYVLGCPLDIQMIEEPTSNVKFLGPDKVGLINVDKNMTICYAIDLNDNSYQQDLDLVRKFTSTLGYRGCDALLTSTWPRESHQFLEGSDLEEYRQSAIGIGAGARWASEAAILTRPRYHFVADVGNFYQRVPYKNSSSNGQPVIYTRLISLHGVIPSKEKHQKWLHALSVQPIIYMKQSDLEEAPAAFTTCPYAPIGGGATVSARMDGPPTKKPRTDFAAVAQESTTQGNSGSFFFGGSSARPSNGHAQSSSSSSKTLFIGGLSREMRDRDLMDAIPDATNVRRPSGKGFAFVDFASHDAAKRVYDHANRNGLTVRGRQLTVGWATNTDKKGEGTQSDEALFSTLMRERVLVPPTEDSKTLYVGNLPHCDLEQQHEIKEELVKLFPKVANVLFPSNKTFAFLDFESYADAMEALSSTLTHQISLKGRPIVVGWSRHGGAKAASHAHPPDPDCKVLFVGNLDGKVTDEDIRKLWSSVTVESIRRPAGRDYAFVEFSSPADAQQAMETICSEDVILNDQQLKFGWAKGKPAAQSDESKECWFCLASPMLKAHLVISVGQYTYLAMPRGAITDDHVLICPIDCVPSRLHLSLDAKQELLKFVRCLEMYYDKIGCAMIMFERAIRTKSGRDHMQVQCIGIPKGKVVRAEEIFHSKAEQNGLHFHQVKDGQSVDDTVMNMEGGPFQEYFYVELPMSSGRRSLVYVQENDSISFPMQFGNEVTTAILGCPERAHWKHCLLTETQEERQSSAFRDRFAPFDFTLS